MRLAILSLALLASSASAADWQPVTTELVLTSAGIVESTDGGTTWAAPIAVPKELKGTGGLTWLEFDPTADVLYIMKMGSELYSLKL